MKRGPYKGRQKEYEEVRQLREQNWGLLAISKKTGVATSTVKKWTKDIDVDPEEAFKTHLTRRESSATGKEALRRMLIAERGHHCEQCGRDEWMNRPISIEMHRIKPSDGYVDTNIFLLCPNCHSVTPNYRNKTAPD